jgi:uncharacterized membrane protein
VQISKSVSRSEGAGSFEVEGSIFLLIAAGLFFSLEAVFHYDDFLHEITLKSVSSVALALVIGSVIIGLIYFWLAYSCWGNRDDPEYFTVALFVCGFLVLAYFVEEITASAYPQFFVQVYLNYFQFISGYGSVTIFVEMLVVFFTYRAEKLLRKNKVQDPRPDSSNRSALKLGH